MTSINPQQPAPPEVASSDRKLSFGSRFLITLGDPFRRALIHLGNMSGMGWTTLMWAWRSVVLRQVRFGRMAFYAQVVRVGVRSASVVALVSSCVGLILAMQMAPPLADFNQTDKVATIIAIAIVRELGPLISAIVLTGFAGASIAAELGTMVVGEEVEALEAHALNPVRFLVMPRLLATTVSQVVLCIMASVVAIASGLWVGVFILGISYNTYMDNTINALDLADFFTGVFKAGVFGMVIGSIACYNGLNVKGGAEGVGKATTYTVVNSIVTIIFTDLIFTTIFYRLGWT